MKSVGKKEYESFKICLASQNFLKESDSRDFFCRLRGGNQVKDEQYIFESQRL